MKYALVALAAMFVGAAPASADPGRDCSHNCRWKDDRGGHHDYRNDRGHGGGKVVIQIAPPRILLGIGGYGRGYGGGHRYRSSPRRPLCDPGYYPDEDRYGRLICRRF